MDAAPHAADLELARAVAAGDQAALRRFDAEVLPAIDAVVRRIDAAPAFLAEVRQALRLRLLVAETGAAPRIAGYKGDGPLTAWVRVAAVRLAINLKRADGPVAPAPDRLAELVDTEPDPELRHLKQTYRAEFAAALTASLAALSERQRVILRLCYVDGLRLARIADLYQVHESTASRWVTAALEAVADGTRRRLIEALSLSPSAADSVARMVQSNLDLSIARLL
jgi:RNA polymerase sigma-70 factor (ECF subfamily)